MKKPQPSSGGTPYVVSLTAPITFYFKGYNVPVSVSIDNPEESSVTFHGHDGRSIVYRSTAFTIPTIVIRISSAQSSQIRTVKVNTQINLNQNLTDSTNISGPLYLFHNSQGGISLVTPNYAGNVPDDERDVIC